MGAFASMAQNSYGLIILGAVSVAFGLLFLVQLIYRLRKNNFKSPAILIELASLTVLSFLFPFRLFYLPFPHIEWVLGVAGITLVLVYLQKMIVCFQQYQSKNSLLTLLLLIFHVCIILFTVAMITVSFIPHVAAWAGIAAFVLLLIFTGIALLKKQFQVDGENVAPFSLITHFKDQSPLLISLYFIFSLYFAFTVTGILPKLYSDKFPQAYFELVNQAETGKETPVDDKYKHEEFKKMYDQFVKRNIENEKSGITR
jgi:hypothetical protein